MAAYEGPMVRICLPPVDRRRPHPGRRADGHIISQTDPDAEPRPAFPGLFSDTRVRSAKRLIGGARRIRTRGPSAKERLWGAAPDKHCRLGLNL
jgi:hypothetical protein